MKDATVILRNTMKRMHNMVTGGMTERKRTIAQAGGGEHGRRRYRDTIMQSGSHGTVNIVDDLG